MVFILIYNKQKMQDKWQNQISPWQISFIQQGKRSFISLIQEIKQFQTQKDFLSKITKFQRISKILDNQEDVNILAQSMNVLLDFQSIISTSNADKLQNYQSRSQINPQKSIFSIVWQGIKGKYIQLLNIYFSDSQIKRLLQILKPLQKVIKFIQQPYKNQLAQIIQSSVEMILANQKQSLSSVKDIQILISLLKPICQGLNIQGTYFCFILQIYTFFINTQVLQKRIYGINGLQKTATFSLNKRNKLLKNYILQWLQISGLSKGIVSLSLHPQLLKRSGALIRLLYQNNLTPPGFLQKLIEVHLQKDIYDSLVFQKILQSLIPVIKQVDFQILLGKIQKQNTFEFSPQVINLLTMASRSKLIQRQIEHLKTKFVHFQCNNVQAIQILQQYYNQTLYTDYLHKFLNLIQKNLFSTQSSQTLTLLKNILYENPLLKLHIGKKFLNKIDPEQKSLFILNFLDIFIDNRQLLQLYIKQGLTQFWLKLVMENSRWDLLKWVYRNNFRKRIDKKIVGMVWQCLTGSIQQRDRKEIIQFFLKGIENCKIFNQDAIYFLYFEKLIRINPIQFNCQFLNLFIKYFYFINQQAQLIQGSKSQVLTINSIQLIGINLVWNVFNLNRNNRIFVQIDNLLIKIYGGLTSNKEVDNQIVISFMEKFKIAGQYFIQKQQNYQLQRLINLIAKVFQIRQRIILLKKQQSPRQYLEIKIINKQSCAKPPQKFYIKVSSDLTLSQLAQVVGKRVRPSRKANQISLLNRGNILKGKGNLRQLRIQSMMTIMVISNNNQQQTTGNKIELQAQQQRKFKQITSFVEVEHQLLRYIIKSKPNDDISQLIQVLMEPTFNQFYANQLRQINKNCKLSQNNISLSSLLYKDQQGKKLLHTVMNMNISETSDICLDLLYSLPNQMISHERLKQVLTRKQPCWQQQLQGSNRLKFLFYLKNIQSLILGQDIKNDTQNQKSMRVLFLQKKGLKFLYDSFIQIDFASTVSQIQKRIAHIIIRLIAFFLKLFLLQHGNLNSRTAVQKIIKHKQNLKDITTINIRSILEESVDKSVSKVSSSFKSFSFKFKSSDVQNSLKSQQVTPNFQSPQTSRSASPHSTPPIKQQSGFGGEKQNEVSFISEKNNKKKITVGVLSQIYINLKQSQLIQQSIVMQTLTDKFLQVLKKSIFNINFAYLADSTIDIILPLLVVQQSLDCVLQWMNLNINIIFKAQNRLRPILLFLLFMLCLLGDQSQVIGEVKIVFCMKLMKLIQDETLIDEELYIALAKIIQSLEQQQYGKLYQIQSLTEKCWKICNQKQDSSQLSGCIFLLTSLQKKRGYQQADWPKAIMLIQKLFDIPENIDNLNSYPLFKSKSTRQRALSLILQITSRRGNLIQSKRQQLLAKLPAKIKQLQDVSIRTSLNDFAGLKNLGATCYVNSLLQLMYMNSSIRNYFNCQKIKRENQPIFQQIRQLFLQLQFSVKSVINPRRLIQKIVLSGQKINFMIQQDVNQLLASLTDQLQQQQQGCLQQFSFLIGGQIQNQVISLQQQYPFASVSSEKFYSLNVEIKGCNNLKAAFDKFLKGQVLQGQNTYFCEYYGCGLKVLRRTCLKSLPNTLILTLKRFQFDYYLMSKHKVNDYFQFPLQIDFKQWTRQGLKLRQDPRIPRVSLQFLNKQQNFTPNLQGYKYKLKGILVHSGTIQAGHYYSYIAHNQNWFQFNDQNILPFKEEDIPFQCYGGYQDREYSKSKSAYLLFYQRDSKQYIQISSRMQQQMRRRNIQFLRSKLIHNSYYYSFLEQIQESRCGQKMLQI